MSEAWGRVSAAGTWPHPKPVWTLTVLIMALTSSAVTAVWQYEVLWTPLQQAYAPTYLRCRLMAALGFSTTGRYRLLEVEALGGTRLALEEEVQPVPAGRGDAAFALTTAALRVGDRGLAWREASYPHAALQRFLDRWIYRDHTIRHLLTPAFWGGLVVLVAGLVVAVPKDMMRARGRRQGRRLKGPELVTVGRFNRWSRADGIGFVEPRRIGRRSTWVRIPRALESSHVLIMGDSGTGKSALIRQILTQIEARGETAIVYDPALEYTPQFYTPARGDAILNPLDARSPYWTPSDEWRHEAETLTLATSLFPDRPHENAFFTEAPRRLFAHLLTLRPTPEQLAWWLCHEEEIDERLAGTAYATMIDRHAPAQRSGVLASLNMVADTLKLLPPERETTQRWSATAWANTWPHGWLFLTSTPETRPRLVPLTSLWLDTLVLRLMNQGQPRPHPTWFVLDELASLQRLPQLHTAITENRKSNNPVVLGFQGRSQLETRYGHDAEAMLSQPAAKIFLRTSEPHAAKWIADTLGDIEIERLRESRSSSRGGQQTYGLERQTEPLVMPSEITGLASLRGFLKVGNLVVRLRFPFIHLPKKAAAFVQRAVPARRHDAMSVASDSSRVPVASPSTVDVDPARALHQQGVDRAVEPFF
ncbi:MAG: type IV secretion system DNA-binding domain-containing protein [Acidobacteriota bacterium]